MNFSIGKTTFIAGEDFTHSAIDAEDRWTLDGVEKLIGCKLWERVRGADHRLKVASPPVEYIRSLAASLAVEPAKQPAATAAPKTTTKTAAPVHAMSPAAALAILAAAEAKASPIKTAAPAASAYSPDALAAKINGEKPAVGHGWDDVIEKMNGKTAKRRS